MDEERIELDTLGKALVFLLLVVVSVVLSYLALDRQRQALCLTLQGEEVAAEQVGDVYPLRLGASALVVGALGFFFMLALENCRTADAHDTVARASAARNVVAGFLVLLAALIRLFDLNFVRRSQLASAREALPQQGGVDPDGLY